MKIEFHHINCVSKDVEGLDLFYRDILQMQPIPAQQFVRTEATNKKQTPYQPGRKRSYSFSDR